MPAPSDPVDHQTGPAAAKVGPAAAKVGPAAARTCAGLAFAVHDHADCAAGTLARARAAAEGQGLRLTPVRQRTLEILLETHRALGAYEVLDRLAAEGFGRQPPVVYRALDFLVDAGLAHRVARLNAFAACMHPGEAHQPAFLICRTCHAVAEAPAGATRSALEAAAAGAGFAVERATIEALGLCAACTAGAAA